VLPKGGRSLMILVGEKDVSSLFTFPLNIWDFLGPDDWK
jgi:hypothetical protein